MSFRLFFAIGCYLAPLMCFPLFSAQASAQANDAQVTFFRKSMFRASGIGSVIFINDQYVGHGNSGKWSVTVPNGTHAIAVKWCDYNPMSGNCRSLDDIIAATESAESSCKGSYAGGPAFFFGATGTQRACFEARAGDHIVFTLEGANLKLIGGDPFDPELGKAKPRAQAIAAIGTSLGAGSREKAALEACLSGNETDTCRQFLTDFPDNPQREEALQHMNGLVSKEMRLRELRSRMPPEMRRDQLMVTLAGLLERGEHQRSLAVFEELEMLPVPLDPDIKFYWGRSLIETGNYMEGLSKVYAYLQERGREASFYQEALNLISRAEAEL